MPRTPLLMSLEATPIQFAVATRVAHASTGFSFGYFGNGTCAGRVCQASEVRDRISGIRRRVRAPDVGAFQSLGDDGQPGWMSRSPFPTKASLGKSISNVPCRLGNGMHQLGLIWSDRNFPPLCRYCAQSSKWPIIVWLHPHPLSER